MTAEDARKVFVSCAITGGMTVPGPEPGHPGHARGDRRLGRGGTRGGSGDRPRACPRPGDREALPPTSGSSGGDRWDRRALQRDRPADDRRRRRHDDRRAGACSLRLPAGAGELQHGELQLRDLPGPSPPRDGALGDRLSGIDPGVRLPEHVRGHYRLAELFREAGTKPELETYDVGHLYNVAHLLEQELLDPPLHIQFVLGVLGANAATLEQLLHMRRTANELFGAGTYTWSAAGVGYPGEFHLAATALMLGGHVRVGLEDNLRLDLERRAESNAELVEKAMTLVPLLDREPATADEARAILGLRPR